MNCLICRSEAVYGDLCKPCYIGLESFQRNTKFLGRAISHVTKKHKLITKYDRRTARKRKVELAQLVAEQKADASA